MRECCTRDQALERNGGGIDMLEHTMCECVRWINERRCMGAACGCVFDVDNLVVSMLESESTWQDICERVTRIMPSEERMEYLNRGAGR